MKKRNLFITLGLALGLGVAGVAGLAQGKEAVEVDAADHTYSVIGWGETGTWATDHDMVDNGQGVFISETLNAPANTNRIFKVRYDHAWTTSYGGDNVLYKPTTTNNSVWTSDGNAGFWSETAIDVKICFRPSDQMIAIIPADYTFPTEWFNFYLNQNNEWPDWNSPRINYWTSKMGVVWNNSPALNYLDETYTYDSVTGHLHSISIPADTTGLLVAKSDLSGQTGNFAISNMNYNFAHFTHTDADYLVGHHIKESADGAYLRGDWTNGWSAEGQFPMTSSSESGPYSINGVDLGGGNAVKALYITKGIVEHWCQFNGVTSNDDINYPVDEIDDGQGGYNAGVVSTGRYNIVVTKNANGKWDYAFTGTSNADLDAACAYARSFVSAMFSECPYNWSESQTQGTDVYNDGKTSETLATAWAEQKVAFYGLSEEVRSYLTNKQATAADITNMFGRYDYVYGKYATVRAVQGADFLGRTPSITANLTIASGIINSETVPVYAIAIIAVASLVTVGGVFLLRRKEN